MVLEKILESPLDCKEIKPVIPKGNQSWILIGGTDAEAPIIWPPDAKSQLIGKAPDARKDLKQEKGMTEDEMFGWHHWLYGLEFEQALGVGNGQESLMCCSVRGQTWLSNWTTITINSKKKKPTPIHNPRLSSIFQIQTPLKVLAMITIF